MPACDKIGAMKFAKNWIPVVTLVMAAGCGSSSSTSTPDIREIDVSPPSATINTISGNTVQFTAIARDQNFNSVAGVAFTWSSSDPTIACVDQNGLATAIKLDPTAITIFATSGGLIGSAALFVNGGPPPPPTPPPPGCK